jgi:TPR repeat protein
MAIIDTPEEVCLCGGKLNFVRDSPNHVCGQYAPQDELWTCPLCGKFYVKTWHPDNIDYYTENADYDAHFIELKSDNRLCVFCNGFRTSEKPVFERQPVCVACFITKEWEALHRRGKVKNSSPSDEEMSEFLAGIRAIENDYFLEGRDKIKPFADAGISLAECYFGELCENGPAEIKNYDLAFEFYNRAARQKLPYAFFRIGKIFANASGRDVNYSEAYKWFNLGAFFGDLASVKARESISKKLSQDEILKAQSDSSLEIKKSWHSSDCRLKILDNLKRSLGELEGTLRFAEILEGKECHIFLLDYQESETFYRNLAGDGFPPAMARLGEKLALGLGVTSNQEEASELLIQAISRGSFQAIEFCWNSLIEGTKLNIDKDWLKERFMAAIDSANTQAIFTWGILNQDGKGIAKNPEEAHKWCNLAQYLGFHLPFPGPFEALEKSLGVEGVERAINSAQEWLESHQGKNQNIRRLIRSFRQRVMTEGNQKWLPLGELFLTGAQGYLRNPFLASGCFQLAQKSGDVNSKLRVEALSRILPDEVTQKSPGLALQMEMTGNLPTLRVSEAKS